MVARGISQCFHPLASSNRDVLVIFSSSHTVVRILVQVATTSGHIV